MDSMQFDVSGTALYKISTGEYNSLMISCFREFRRSPNRSLASVFAELQSRS